MTIPPCFESSPPLLAIIEKALFKLSKNRNIFDLSICTYQNALDKLNFKHKLTYKEDFKKQKIKRNRPKKYCISILHFSNQ